MKKTERRCPPYEGSDPYLNLCFAVKDSGAVFPVLEHLYQRGVRVWYSLKATANIEKLNHQQERMNNASLLVIYLSENARHDERVKNTLIYYQHGKPVICVDTDDGDNELMFGLTGAARHINGRTGRNRDDLEAELIRTEGFTQELIGEPVKKRTRTRTVTACILAATLLTAGVIYYQYISGQYGKTPGEEPGTAAMAAALTPASTSAPTPTPTPEPTPEPTPTMMPDTVFFPDGDFTDAVRRATAGGVITEESLAEIRTLEIGALPEDLSLLDRLPGLEKLKLPQGQALYALAVLGGRYTIVLAPEEVTAQ